MRRTLVAQDGESILVCHSYGGAVITEAGNNPKVARLVYITAFAPDKRESVSTLIQNPPPGVPAPPILPPHDYFFLGRANFATSFAADVDPVKAAFMADLQVPWGVVALGGAISEPAWKVKPSWCLIATEDKMIPPDAQRAVSTRAGSTVWKPGAATRFTSLRPPLLNREGGDSDEMDRPSETYTALVSGEELSARHGLMNEEVLWLRHRVTSNPQKHARMSSNARLDHQPRAA